MLFHLIFFSEKFNFLHHNHSAIELNYWYFHLHDKTLPTSSSTDEDWSWSCLVIFLNSCIIDTFFLLPKIRNFRMELAGIPFVIVRLEKREFQIFRIVRSCVLEFQCFSPHFLLSVHNKNFPVVNREFLVFFSEKLNLPLVYCTYSSPPYYVLCTK